MRKNNELIYFVKIKNKKNIGMVGLVLESTTLTKSK